MMIIVVPVVSCEKVEVFLILNDMNNDLGTQLCKTRICLNVVSNIHPLVRRDLCRVICPLANVLFCPFMLELENLLSCILNLVIKDLTTMCPVQCLTINVPMMIESDATYGYLTWDTKTNKTETNNG